MAKRYQRVIRSNSKQKNKNYPLVSFGHCIVCHSSVYGYFWLPFGIFWPLYCLLFFCLQLLLITLWYLLTIALFVILRFTVISDYPLVSFGHCIVCHSSVYSYFWLPFGIFWPLHCLSFFGLRLFLITLWYLLDITLSVILLFTATSDYPLVSFLQWPKDTKG
jgi:ABC-type multidrug transport system permease subunit